MNLSELLMTEPEELYNHLMNLSDDELYEAWIDLLRNSGREKIESQMGNLQEGTFIRALLDKIKSIALERVKSRER